MNFQLKSKKGFVLLFTIVVISIIVGITVSMMQLSSRGSSLGALQSNAQAAFAAADSGLECGLMMTYSTGTSSATQVSCGSIASLVNTSLDPAQEKYSFDFSAAVNSSGRTDDNVHGCGIILIKRSASWESLGVPQSGILVESYGYNVCIPRSGNRPAMPDTNNTVLIERKMIARIPETSSI